MSTRRKRTTQIQIVVNTSINDVAKLLKLHPATVSARYHRIHDKYPRRAVLLEALAESHQTSSFKERLR